MLDSRSKIALTVQLSSLVAGMLAFTDLFQVHLLLAMYFGVKLARRWQIVWPAVAVASCAYAVVACGIAFVGYTPSGYLVLIFGMLADVPFEAALGYASKDRLWAVGVCVTFLVLAGIPTAVAWLLRHRLKPPRPKPEAETTSWKLPLVLGIGLLAIQQMLIANARRFDSTMAEKLAGGVGFAMTIPILVVAAITAYRVLRRRVAR